MQHFLLIARDFLYIPRLMIDHEFPVWFGIFWPIVGFAENESALSCMNILLSLKLLDCHMYHSKTSEINK